MERAARYPLWAGSGRTARALGPLERWWGGPRGPGTADSRPPCSGGEQGAAQEGLPEAAAAGAERGAVPSSPARCQVGPRLRQRGRGAQRILFPGHEPQLGAGQTLSLSVL